MKKTSWSAIRKPIPIVPAKYILPVGRCDAHNFTYLSLIGDGVHNIVAQTVSVVAGLCIMWWLKILLER